MTDLALPPDLAPAPTTLFASDDPVVIVARATRIADAIAPLIRERALVKRIGASEHVYLEGWTLAGTMLGVFATTVRTWEIGDDHGYGATVEARTMGGSLVGRADAVVMRSEQVGGKQKWLEAPAFQLISMAQTRASSKALRMPLGFVMKLAGYETTPAEEMEQAAARGETVSGGRGVKLGWRDKAEQDTAHRRMHAYLDEHGLHDLAAQIMESKGYDPPMSKPQMSDLRRVLDRELAERGTENPPASEQEVPPSEAGRSEAGGANHDGTTQPGAREVPPPTDATAPPGEAAVAPRQQPPGGPERSRSAEGTGKLPAGRAPTTTEGSDAPDAVTDVKQAGPADPKNREGEAGSSLPEDPSPVLAWCDANGVDIRHAKTYLRRSHAKEWRALQDWKDLEDLRPPRSDQAIQTLTAWVNAGAEP